MFSDLSLLLCEYLINHNRLKKDEKELYTYGIYLVIANIFFLLLVLFFGLLFKCLIKTLVFYISFRIIRSFAGGYHADTETRCEILTTLSFLCVTIIISRSELVFVQTIVLLLTLISIPTIVILSPLDTPAKPLDSGEKKKYKMISCIILLVIVCTICSSLIFDIKLLLVPCCLSLILESILLLSGKFKGNIVNER